MNFTIFSTKFINIIIISLISVILSIIIKKILRRFKKDKLKIFILEDDQQYVLFYKLALEDIVKNIFDNKVKLKIISSMDFPHLHNDLNDRTYDLFIIDWLYGKFSLDSKDFKNKLYDPNKVYVITGDPTNEKLMDCSDGPKPLILVNHIYDKSDKDGIKLVLIYILQETLKYKNNGIKSIVHSY